MKGARLALLMILSGAVTLATLLSTLMSPALMPAAGAFGGASKKDSDAVNGKTLTVDDKANPYPDGSEASKLFTLGTRQLENREFRKARDTFRTLAYKKPQEVGPMIKVSYASAKAGDVDAAIEWGKKACVVLPKSAEAHLQLAHAFEENQDWKAACLQYEVIYEIEPNKQDKLNIEYPMLRSLIKAQEYEKAEGLSAQWIKEYKKSADAYFNRAWTLTQVPDQNHPEEIAAEAEKNYRMAIKLNSVIVLSHN